MLVSLNSARGKAQDTAVKASLMAVIPEALTYVDQHGSFSGFRSSVSLPECSGEMIVNISVDGKEIAIFGKICSKEDLYFCVDSSSPFSGPIEVNEELVRFGSSRCSETFSLSDDVASFELTDPS